jgi:hypothetical protein
LKSNFNPKKSTELLNNVLVLVGQSPITDIRNRNIVRKKVNDAIAIIREVAEQVYTSKEKEEKLDVDDNPEIILDDTQELVINFKYLVDSSDYLEKIRLLTLVPKSWGRLKVTSFFSCSEHQARYGIYLRDVGQILSLPVDLRGNIAFDPVIEKEIFDFFHSDDISRV